MASRRLAAVNQALTTGDVRVSTVADVGEYDSHDDNHLRVNEVRRCAPAAAAAATPVTDC